jgi:ATP-dependent HslUV protease subunit HslV
MNDHHSTTIIALRHNGKLAMGADGQVTLADKIIKHRASKVRYLYNNKVLVGFAGAAADALALLERLEGKLEEYQGNLKRAAVELTKEWRTDRYLRRLEAQIITGDKDTLLLLTGQGEVLEPDESIIGIGSGGAYAQAAAYALRKHRPDLSAYQIVEEALKIAASICVYTNTTFHIEEI